MVCLGLLGWVAHGVGTSWEAEDWSHISISPLGIAGSSGALLLAYLLRAWIYGCLLRGLEPGATRVSNLTAAKIFFASQAGRYLPGKIWQFSGAAWLASRFGLSAAAAVSASLLIAVLQLGVGALLALSVVGSAFTDGVVLLGAGAVALTSALVLASGAASRGFAWLVEKTGGRLAGVGQPPIALLVRLIPGSLAIWLLFGSALWLLDANCLAGLHPGKPLSWLDAVGVMAASCVAGIAVLIAPAGLGVRDATMAALLAPLVGIQTAGLLAILMRIEMTVVEAVLITWGVQLGTRHEPVEVAHPEGAH
jgi:hypothetical protein